MDKYLWMAVTPDELELPIAVADTGRELNEMLGVKGNVVQKMLCWTKQGKIKKHYKYKIVKVKIRGKL